MDSRDQGKQKEADQNPRTIVWTAEHAFQGWTCSQCEWNYPVPTFLEDAEAKTAYDRLAAGRFKTHSCSDHLSRLAPADPQSFTSRIRKLVAQGFKPKDAVELLLQELALEYGNQPQVLEQARVAGEDFLRRVRAGVI